MLDIDTDTYLNYVVTSQQLKTPPAFDRTGVLIPAATHKNNKFGDETGKAVNFTDYSLWKVTKIQLRPLIRRSKEKCTC